MNRRSILKSLLSAPFAMVFGKTANSEQAIIAQLSEPQYPAEIWPILADVQKEFECHVGISDVRREGLENEIWDILRRCRRAGEGTSCPMAFGAPAKG